MSKLLASAIALSFVLAGCSAEPDRASGADLYVNYCASCHGLQGEGDGPVAAVMQVNVPNLRTLAMRSDGEFPTDAVTAYVDGRQSPSSHGDRRMPIWGNVFQWNEGADSEDLARRRIEAVVEFIGELQYR